MVKSPVFQLKNEITNSTSNIFNIKTFINLKIRLRKNKQ